MNSILIISEHFYPNNVIGARRPTKLSKKLHESGYHVDVFARYGAENISDICDNLFSFDVLEKTRSSKATVSGKTHGRVYTLAYHLLYPLRILRNAYAVGKEFRRLISEENGKRYDVVISSFGPLSSLVCGLYYKKKHPQVKWICDFRDPVVVKYIPTIWKPVFRMYERKACRNADAIVAVSNGYLDRICKGKYLEKAHMIPNGYDEDDAVLGSSGKLSDEILRITYVGALYGGDRDLTPLFKALSELSAEGLIDKNKILVSYAGNEYEVMEGQAQKFGLTDILENCGVLSREDCLNLQFSSNMLLLSTWNDKNEHGVFPGKLLEYMLIGRPILSLTSGDLPDGEVTRVVREADLGVTYEASCDERDFPLLKEYLKRAYTEWKESGYIVFDPNKEVLDRYDYKTIMKKIEELIHG